MDFLTPEQRHKNMSRVHSRDTKPELTVRRWLWRRGYRYRLHNKKLPGSPDIVLPKYRAVIFINGCFWHRHGCKMTSTPKTRTDFWEAKFLENVNRDDRNVQALIALGWSVMIIWGCEIKHWDTILETKIQRFFEVCSEGQQIIAGNQRITEFGTDLSVYPEYDTDEERYAAEDEPAYN